VTINGSNADELANVRFTCNTSGGSGSFTIPASILMQLPATSADDLENANENGVLSVTVRSAPVTLNVPLTAGGTVKTYYEFDAETPSQYLTYK
jgi:hypothetical protein